MLIHMEKNSGSVFVSFGFRQLFSDGLSTKIDVLLNIIVLGREKRFSTSAVNKGTGLWKNGYLYKDIQSNPLRCRVGKKGRSLFYFGLGEGYFWYRVAKGSV